MASRWRVSLVYVAIRLNNTRARFDLVRLLPESKGRAAPVKVPKVKGAAGVASASAADLKETGGHGLVRVEAVSHASISWRGSG